MAEIKNPEAYFGALVRNSYKNEFRANDNYFNHVSSVGDEADIQRESPAPIAAYGTDAIEQRIGERSAENWLLLMENNRLHTALCSLPMTDVEFLLGLAGFMFNQAAYAEANGVTRQSVSKRFCRLRKKIIEIF